MSGTRMELRGDCRPLPVPLVVVEFPEPERVAVGDNVAVTFVPFV